MANPEMTSSASLITAGHPMVPKVARVLWRKQESEKVFTLGLSPPANSLNEGSLKNRFEPGQFNMLYLPGKGDVPISISGDPDDDSQWVHTIREVGKVTEGLSRLNNGDQLGIRGPFGAGWPMLESAGKDVLLIAGGLGLAPLRPVIYRLLSNNDCYRYAALLYGGRSDTNVLFQDEMKVWSQRGLRVKVTVDYGSPQWQGEVGVVTNLIQRALIDPERILVMLCGPEIMMRFSIDELLKKGVREEDIYVSMERNMKCAIGFCGHCQWGPKFICKDGPVFQLSTVKHLLDLWEL